MNSREAKAEAEGRMSEKTGNIVKIKHHEMGAETEVRVYIEGTLGFEKGNEIALIGVAELSTLKADLSTAQERVNTLSSLSLSIEIEQDLRFKAEAENDRLREAISEAITFYEVMRNLDPNIEFIQGFIETVDSLEAALGKEGEQC